MKIRNGFVSNSSSASFIIKWRKKDSNLDPESNLKELMGGDYEYFRRLVNFVQERSVVTDDGWIETSNWTAMMNALDDFSDDIKSLLMYLAINNGFEFEARVEDDH